MPGPRFRCERGERWQQTAISKRTVSSRIERWVSPGRAKEILRVSPLSFLKYGMKVLSSSLMGSWRSSNFKFNISTAAEDFSFFHSQLLFFCLFSLSRKMEQKWVCQIFGSIFGIACWLVNKFIAWELTSLCSLPEALEIARENAFARFYCSPALLLYPTHDICPIGYGVHAPTNFAAIRICKSWKRPEIQVLGKWKKE